jgi:hypothetical protein
MCCKYWQPALSQGEVGTIPLNTACANILPIPLRPTLSQPFVRTLRKQQVGNMLAVNVDAALAACKPRDNSIQTTCRQPLAGGRT